MIRPGTAPARAAALALLLAVLVAGFGAVLTVVERIRSLDADIAERRALVSRLRGLGTDAGSLQTAIERLESDDSRSDLVLDASSDRVATAELQQRIKAIVASTGGTLTSARVLESEPAGSLRRVGLEVRVSLGVEGLRDTLYQLESGAPVLLVENLTIVARRASRRRARATTSAPQLDVRFRLNGFMPDATVSGEGAEP